MTINDQFPVHHQPADLAEFERLGIDPQSTQPREKPALCSTCGRSTWNQGARGLIGCDRHYVHRTPDSTVS